MSVWTNLYPIDVDPRLDAHTGTLDRAWRDRLLSAPEAPAVRYFDAVFTAREADETSDALAVEFQERSVRPGDIVGIQLQNIPQFAINVPGYKVWPREVEDALYEHPAVREATVRGRSNPCSGEEVVAFVSLQSNYQSDDGVGIRDVGEDSDGALRDSDDETSGTHRVLKGELRPHVKDRLAEYKCPTEVFLVGDLPKTTTGKIQRRALSGEAGEVLR